MRERSVEPADEVVYVDGIGRSHRQCLTLLVLVHFAFFLTLMQRIPRAAVTSSFLSPLFLHRIRENAGGVADFRGMASSLTRRREDAGVDVAGCQGSSVV